MITMWLTRFIILFILSLNFLYSDEEVYTFSVCTTVDYLGAVDCKNKVLKNSTADIYIIQGEDKKFRTLYGTFANYHDAKQYERLLVKNIKAQKPFIKSYNFSNGTFYLIEKYSSNNSLKEKQKENKVKINTKSVEMISSEDNKNQTLNPNMLIPIEKINIENNIPQTPVAIKSNITEQKSTNNTKSSNIEISFFEMILTKIKNIFQNRNTDEVNIRIDLNKSFEVSQEYIQEFNATLTSDKNITKESKIQIATSSLLNTYINTKDTINARIPTENLPLVVEKEEKNQIKREAIHFQENPKITQIPLQNSYSNSIPLSNDELLQYENITISVNSTTNRLYIDGYKKGTGIYSRLKEYIVSTGKRSILKPTGTGNITAISFSPTWYPTPTTLKNFKAKGINLPHAIPPGHKYNFMGPAKIHLSHQVKGRDVYRIHGTLSESTIGTNESGGCIRMKNKEVLELANILKTFTRSTTKGYNSIKVILK